MDFTGAQMQGNLEIAEQEKCRNKYCDAATIHSLCGPFFMCSWLTTTNEAVNNLLVSQLQLCFPQILDGALQLNQARCQFEI